MRVLTLLLAAAGLAGCGQGNDQTVKQPPAKQEKPKYCFFKDAESKGWAARRGKDGNIVVTGKLYRSDGRYMATLGEPTIKGATAELWPSITTNTTGHSMPDGWWDVKATIPNSAAIDTVAVKCGKKSFAELKVPRA